MKCISWNVNGLRACLNKGFLDYFKNIDADIFCLQETKMQPGQADLELPGYYQYWNSAEKKGYSGTAVFAKREPLQVINGLGITEHDTEGRIITLEYPDFFLVNVYTPNSKRQLERLDYRMHWEDDFRNYLTSLKENKGVLVCGDMNVAHKEIDLKNPKTNTGNAGFTPQEREKFSLLLSSGFIDTFRYFYPQQEAVYSWWSYMYHARQNNAGWRIDYFLASSNLENRLNNAFIDTAVMGSDHCPVGLEINL